MRRIFPLIAFLLFTIEVRSQTNNPAPYCSGSIGTASFLQIDSVIFFHYGGVSMTNISWYPAYQDRYTYFSNKSYKMLPGLIYQLRLGFSGDTAHFFAVYIDWNGDNDFTDANERVVHRVRTLGQPIPKSIFTPITAPLTIMQDTVRMRVVLFEDDAYTYGAMNSNATPCTAFGGGSLDHGEVEDYVIVLAETPVLTTLPATAVTGNSARLNGKIQWKGAGGIAYFNCSSQMGSIYPTSFPGADTVAAVISNLQPNQTYTFSIQASVESYYTASGGSLSFTTAPTGIHDAERNPSLYLIFPNPAQKSITIQTPHGAARPTHVVALDATGRRAGIYAVAADGSVTFNDLPAGLYALAVWTTEGCAFRQSLLLTGQ